MNKLSKWGWSVLIFALVNMALILLNSLQEAAPLFAQPSTTGEETLSGVVVNQDGPVAGATVRVQLSLESTLTAEDGSFTLTGLEKGQSVTVTAWAAGHYIGMNVGAAGGPPIEITLFPYFMTDNHLYEWASRDGVKGSASCGLCHTAYVEWQADAHGQSATNPRFLSMYAGTDIHGNRSPEPEKTSLGIPLPPDLNEPYYGPGHSLDYPNRPGNCATCHIPVAAKMTNKQNCSWSGCHATTVVANSYGLLENAPFPIDLTGTAAEGITCEFCHKIGDVILNRETKLPYADMPGILSVRLHRPREGQDIFFGTVDDAHPAEIGENHDTYLPLLKESAFCASCHYGIMGGVVGNMQVTNGVLVYNSYGEWLDSPYSDPETGQTCQDCHMPVVETDAETNYFVFPEQGGLARDPSQVHNHRMLGISDEEFMQNSVSMTTTAKVVGDQVLVNVRITNDRTGHHIPTDSPLRHMMLVVEVKDASGQPLFPTAGSTLPDWAGNYAGLPGRMFAKVLQDEWTGEMPTGAYWRPVRLVSDTRLPAHKTSASYYQFAIPNGSDSQDLTVETRLIFRRAYQQLQEWKDWNDPDILMKEEIVRLHSQ
ncbi:MAG: carboxypeptidase regulatory-like domain-containing protein [Caldilineaceae bacterium]|nr:carboxypeptidase regulatory-like domain-containing protein [Caldilineaceae bacterium]